MVPFILWSFALWNRESLRILFFRHNYELSSYRHVHNDLLICAVYIHYMYRAGVRSTRNALNCINCPILCKRRSSFRAPLWYSSLLSLIHSPTLLSYMSGSPLLSFFLSRRPVSISHARVHLSLSFSLSLSLSLRSHDFHFSQLCRVLLFLARLVLSPYGLLPCEAASGKATEKTVFIFIYVVDTYVRIIVYGSLRDDDFIVVYKESAPITERFPGNTVSMAAVPVMNCPGCHYCVKHNKY